MVKFKSSPCLFHLSNQMKDMFLTVWSSSNVAVSTLKNGEINFIYGSKAQLSSSTSRYWLTLRYTRMKVIYAGVHIANAYVKLVNCTYHTMFSIQIEFEPSTDMILFTLKQHQTQDCGNK